jgi:Fur family transcriptional regulator, ferric uptake regulator
MLDKAAVKKNFMDFAQRKKLRMTAQRMAIVDAALDTNQHFTADELIVWAQKRDKSVSRATVYRTLPLLTESGLLREMDFGQDSKFYDPNYADYPYHNHIICQDCGKIIEFDSKKISDLEAAIGRKLGFTVKSHRLQIIATCEQFRKFGVCDRK